MCCLCDRVAAALRIAAEQRHCSLTSFMALLTTRAMPETSCESKIEIKDWNSLEMNVTCAIFPGSHLRQKYKKYKTNFMYEKENMLY